MARTVGTVHTQVKFNNELNKNIAYPFGRGLFANVKFVTYRIQDG